MNLKEESSKYSELIYFQGPLLDIKLYFPKCFSGIIRQFLLSSVEFFFRIPFLLFWDLLIIPQRIVFCFARLAEMTQMMTTLTMPWAPLPPFRDCHNFTFKVSYKLFTFFYDKTATNFEESASEVQNLKFMLKMKIKICMDLCFLSDGVLRIPAQTHKGKERKEKKIFMK